MRPYALAIEDADVLVARGVVDQSVRRLTALSPETMPPPPPTTQPTVTIIDDDARMRESISSLIRSIGFQTRTMGSVDVFHTLGLHTGPVCLVLDVRLPGQSGLELQRELAARHIELPIVFITGRGDIPMSVQAMKSGAIEFLTKPFRDQDLLDAIQVGLARDQARIADQNLMSALRARFETLAAREREVMVRVVADRLNKQIAGIWVSARLRSKSAAGR